MQKTELVIFNKQNTRELLSDLDFKIKTIKTGKKSRQLVVSTDNNAIFCPTCEKEILLNRVGTIAHGSRLLFCDNPFCFASWVAKNKI